jgi:hypothetical protein
MWTRNAPRSLGCLWVWQPHSSASATVTAKKTLNRRAQTFIVWNTKSHYAKKVKTLMGKQHNKDEHKKRRKAYIKRKKAAIKAKKAAPKKAS